MFDNHWKKSIKKICAQKMFKNQVSQETYQIFLMKFKCCKKMSEKSLMLEKCQDKNDKQKK